MNLKSKYLTKKEIYVTYLLQIRARHWLPTVDYPTVRTTLSWAITAPKDLTALANGTFMGGEINGDYRTTMWELDYPW